MVYEAHVSAVSDEALLITASKALRLLLPILRGSPYCRIHRAGFGLHCIDQ